MAITPVNVSSSVIGLGGGLVRRPGRPRDGDHARRRAQPGDERVQAGARHRGVTAPTARPTTRTASRRSRWTPATWTRTRRPRRRSDSARRCGRAGRRLNAPGSTGCCSSSRRTRPPSERVGSARPTRIAGAVEAGITDAGDAAGLRAHQLGISAYASERRARRLGRVGIGLAFVVFGALWWMLRQQRRRLDAGSPARALPPERDGVERPAHGSAQPPRIPRGPRPRAPAHRPDRRSAGAGAGRSRRSEDDQRHPRAPGRGPADQGARGRAPGESGATDTAYRIGGDEFAVLLPGARGWGALEFAQRLRQGSRRRRWASPPRTPSSPATRSSTTPTWRC